MRPTEWDGEHIWLRQSVTFTVGGETRTVEIAIPLRPGASAEDVETLLNEADAGMERLSRRLDKRVSALLHEPSAALAADTSEQPALPEPAAAAPTGDTHQAEPRLERPLAPTTSAVPETPAPTPAARPTPVRDSASSPAPTHPATAPRPAAPQPARPTSPPAPAPARARPSGALAAAPTPSQGPDLTRPEFIAAAQELGMNVKQAMERLGVRSLEGLNLREALEALRRQALRGTSAATPPAPAHPAASVPAASSEPRYFDEEDDLDVTFSVDGDDELDEEDYAPHDAAAPEPPDALDELDESELDDVPDFGPPPSTSRSAPASARRSSGATAQRRPPSPTRIEESRDQADVGVSGDQTRALQIVGQLRSARGGGVPTSYQRTAYRNVVARELGEPEAAALVRGLWRTTPERLTAEQLDVLVSWGKQDTFSEEAAMVLAALRAERERAASAESQQQAAAETPRAAPRGGSAGSGRSTGSGRTAPGSH